jgi:hypothetical protein
MGHASSLCLPWGLTKAITWISVSRVLDPTSGLPDQQTTDYKLQVIGPNLSFMSSRLYPPGRQSPSKPVALTTRVPESADNKQISPLRLGSNVVSTRLGAGRSHVEVVHTRSTKDRTRDIPSTGKLDDHIDLALRIESNQLSSLPPRAPYATLVVEAETIRPPIFVRVDFGEDSAI